MTKPNTRKSPQSKPTSAKSPSIKLPDTQLLVLSRAAQRQDGAATLPDGVGDKAASRLGVRLAAKGLVREVRAKPGLPVWRRTEEEGAWSLILTKLGRSIVGVDAESKTDGIGDAHAAAPKERRSRAENFAAGIEGLLSLLLTRPRSRRWPRRRLRQPEEPRERRRLRRCQRRQRPEEPKECSVAKRVARRGIGGVPSGVQAEKRRPPKRRLSSTNPDRTKASLILASGAALPLSDSAMAFSAARHASSPNALA